MESNNPQNQIPQDAPTPTPTTQPDKLDQAAAKLDNYLAKLPISGFALVGLIFGGIGFLSILFGGRYFAFFCGLIGLTFASWGFYSKEDTRGFLFAAAFCGFDILVFLLAWIYYYKAGGAMWGATL